MEKKADEWTEQVQASVQFPLQCEDDVEHAEQRDGRDQHEQEQALRPRDVNGAACWPWHDVAVTENIVMKRRAAATAQPDRRLMI